MTRSSSPVVDTNKNCAQELRNFIAELYQHPEHEAVASEVEGEATREACYVHYSFFENGLS
jgi:hypothetical protein